MTYNMPPKFGTVVQEGKAERYVLDVRNNGGGSFPAGVQVRRTGICNQRPPAPHLWVFQPATKRIAEKFGHHSRQPAAPRKALPLQSVLLPKSYLEDILVLWPAATR